jgi:hypothetical protein
VRGGAVGAVSTLFHERPISDGGGANVNDNVRVNLSILDGSIALSERHLELL